MLVPARRVAKASTVVSCSVEPFESNVRNASPDAGVTSEYSDISIAKVLLEAIVPPPLSPAPAVRVTPEWSICSFATKPLRES